MFAPRAAFSDLGSFQLHHWKQSFCRVEPPHVGSWAFSQGAGTLPREKREGIPGRGNSRNEGKEA